MPGESSAEVRSEPEPEPETGAGAGREATAAAGIVEGVPAAPVLQSKPEKKSGEEEPGFTPPVPSELSAAAAASSPDATSTSAKTRSASAWSLMVPMTRFRATISRTEANAHNELFSKERLRALQNPMREYKDQYVINMWKVYNHVYLKKKSTGKLLNLLFYAAYVYVMTYFLAHLPAPGIMLRHQEAVGDLLLGEEFDANTTHIFKNFDDVMTAEEMWQWAQGPLAGGLHVDGHPDGNLAALVGTNWLLGPVRLRQERSSKEKEPKECQNKLSKSFGPDMGEKLTMRGIKCTSDEWQTRNKDDFLNLSTPLEVLEGKTFIEAFPEWYETHARANSLDDDFFCCSQSRCFQDHNDQKKAIKSDGESDFEWACSVDLKRHHLHANPEHAYRSTVKSDSTQTDSLWGGIGQFGTAGFHIDLPGNSSTFVKQLKALEELQFVDQYTRSITFQFVILNSNSFTVSQESLIAPTMSKNFDATVIVAVDVNFVFSSSGHLHSYSRINSMQLIPFHFLDVGVADVHEGVEDTDEEGWFTEDVFWQISLTFVPVWLIVQEIEQVIDVGISSWISSGWNWFELLYIGAMLALSMSIKTYLDEEKRFLLQYKADASEADYDIGLFSSDIPSEFNRSINTQDMFNDVLPLRSAYTWMFKYIGLVSLVVVAKFLKFLRIFKSTSLLWDTLRLAAGQLVAYTAVMLWLIYAFALCSTLIWGPYSESFQNVPSSMFQLVRLAAGLDDIEYLTLKRGDATITPALFLLFVAVVAILGMNLMIAIVTDFYEEARDTLKGYDMDFAWIQQHFSGANAYEDFYRGKGLWNEPVQENATGVIGQVLQALRGTWIVKPVPVGCGPRKWNDAAKEVQALGETQSYPFTLQRSTIVHLRYRVESHEHVNLPAAHGQAEDPVGRKGSYKGSYVGSAGGHTPRVNAARMLSKVVSTSSVAKRQVQQLASTVANRRRRVTTRFAANQQPIDENSPHIPSEDERPTLDLWMAATSLAQLKGIRFLERLKCQSTAESTVDDTSETGKGRTKPGDRILLKTQAEGGMMGHITLEFLGMTTVRRATRHDKQMIAREIESVREKLHDLKVEFDDKMWQIQDEAVREHQERRRSGESADPHWTPLCAGCSSLDCKSCKVAKDYGKEIAAVEHRLQQLHQDRGQLEGVERTMKFKVVDVDSWQKFQPLTTSQAHLGEMLKVVCLNRIKRTTTTHATYKDEASAHQINKEDVIKVVADVVLDGLCQQVSGRNEHKLQSCRSTIEIEIDEIIKKMADEEEAEEKSKGHVSTIIDNRTKSCCCKSSVGIDIVQATKALHTPMKLLWDEGKVPLDLLVPNYGVAHPNVSMAMNRLMKAAQRIDCAKLNEFSPFEHTPLLQVSETADFELQLPTDVQCRVIWRAMCDLCSRVHITKFLLWILPLRFIMKPLYFHPTVEDDVDDFLKAKCLDANTRMTSTVRRSLKLQMRELMSKEHSISLADFTYQLQYFVFKVKSRTAVARFRAWFHGTFEHSCLRYCLLGLRIPLRQHYSEVEEEIAEQYLLREYTDFIDRRDGSIPGGAYTESGVLLDQSAHTVLDTAHTEGCLEVLDAAQAEGCHEEKTDADADGRIKHTPDANHVATTVINSDATQLLSKLDEVQKLLATFQGSSAPTKLEPKAGAEAAVEANVKAQPEPEGIPDLKVETQPFAQARAEPKAEPGGKPEP